MNFKSLCVIGMGYIGLPTASLFASQGLQVTGMDINQDIIQGLQAGQVHIFEPGLREVVLKGLEAGRLVISTEVRPADAFIIAVPTPYQESNPILSQSRLSGLKAGFQGQGRLNSQ